MCAYTHSRRNDRIGERGWWRLAWNCIIRLGTSRISMSCIFHEARTRRRGGNHIAFGSLDAVPSLSLSLSPLTHLLLLAGQSIPCFFPFFVFARLVSPPLFVRPRSFTHESTKQCSEREVILNCYRACKLISYSFRNAINYDFFFMHIFLTTKITEEMRM